MKATVSSRSWESVRDSAYGHAQTQHVFHGTCVLFASLRRMVECRSCYWVALNFTDSSELLGYLVAVNNGMQCFGLIAIMPPLLKFLSLRHVWPLSLFLAFVSRNGHQS